MKEVENSHGRWTKRYYIWQAKVFERDNYECKKCKSNEKLHSHHMIGWDQDVNLRYDVANGLTLCSRCHTRLHSIGRRLWNKGLKTPPDIIKKISESRTGIKRGPHSEEHKKNIGLANKEILKKNSEARRGKTWIKCSETGKRIWIDK